MVKNIIVVRHDRGSSKSYTETFEYEIKEESDTVATALKYFSSLDNLKTIEGKSVRKIEWMCSCLQKKCGSCALKVNSRPTLACSAILSNYGKNIILEPLSKFPVICDLVVDRSIMQENLKTMKLWLTESSILDDKRVMLAHTSSKCIQCGLCLEVCPNFYLGGEFFGVSGLGITTKLLMELPKDKRKDISKEFDKHVFEGCGKSLACKKICPQGLKTDELLVNSVSMAIFKRK